MDLQRELRRGKPGGAHRLLAARQEEVVTIAFVTWMEIAEEYGDEQRGDCELFLAPFRVLWPDADTALSAARISRELSQRGKAIGDHDAWIAALADQHGEAVATRNEKHLGRVPGLAIVSY